MKNKSQENPNKMIIRCPCGEKLTLDRVGGQYQNEYRKKCKCGRGWVLTEISELMAEIEDC
jgi:hypothetical protein